MDHLCLSVLSASLCPWYCCKHVFHCIWISPYFTYDNKLNLIWKFVHNRPGVQFISFDLTSLEPFPTVCGHFDQHSVQIPPRSTFERKAICLNSLHPLKPLQTPQLSIYQFPLPSQPLPQAERPLACSWFWAGIISGIKCIHPSLLLQLLLLQCSPSRFSMRHSPRSSIHTGSMVATLLPKCSFLFSFAWSPNQEMLRGIFLRYIQAVASCC